MAVIVGWVEPGRPILDAPEQCPACGFDSVVTVPMVLLTPRGVTQLPPFKTCSRCIDRHKTP